MATNKQISKCSAEFMELANRIDALKDRKKALQDDLTSITTQLDDTQAAFDLAKTALKALLNE